MVLAPDLCSDCGAELPAVAPGASPAPCPACGSIRRTTRLTVSPGGVTFTGSEVELRTRHVWDGLSLTLAGVLYGIVVTVGGVIVATISTLATVIYAAVALGLLAVGLLLFAQPIIGGMRWLLARGER